MRRTLFWTVCILWGIASSIQAQMTVDGDGNVGIGTSSPSEKLTLSGGNFLQTVSAPKVVGSITDDENTVLNGAWGIFVSGKYAYVTASSTYFDEDNPDVENGVEILDISDPTNPVHVGSIMDDETTALKQPCGICVSGKYAYVAARREGVEILDVSDPANPAHVGAIFDDATTALSGAFGIQVSGKYAYVTSVWDKGLEIIDISDPSNPTHVGAITEADDEHGEYALVGAAGIHVSGKYAYVASSSLGRDDVGLEILDISDPYNPTHVGAIEDNETTALLGACYVRVSGRYAYVAATYDHGVEILDVSNPSNPTHAGAIYDNYDADIKLQFANDIHILGNYAFVSSREGKLEILDISDPSNPQHAFAITNEDPWEKACAMNIQIVGKYAYLAMYDKKGVEIIDISGFDSPSASIGTISTDDLDVSSSAQVGNTLSVGGGLNAGAGGIKSDGPFAAEGDGSFGGRLHVGANGSFGGDVSAAGPVSTNDFLALTPMASPPGSPIDGDMYYDNSEPDHALCIYLNGAWEAVAGAGQCD